MVGERLTLPTKRRTARNRGKSASLAQIKEKVQTEVLPNGLKRITAFLQGRPEMITVPLTGRPVSWYPMLAQVELVDADENVVGTFEGTEAHARYALYAARPGEFAVDVCSDAVTVTKVVQQYECYLQDVGQELHKRFLEATGEAKQALRAARELLEALGLPPIGVEKALRA